jgi:hypothetical protein
MRGENECQLIAAIYEDARKLKKERMKKSNVSEFVDNGDELTDKELASREREFANSRGVL